MDKHQQISDVPKNEDELVQKAQFAVSQCNWVVGECASIWTERYAKGRTDADFAALVGLTADQVYQRRRVWETFSDMRLEFASLKWSHFYVAINWDDAYDCFQWADSEGATVAEMRSWRKSIRGDDDPDEYSGQSHAELLSLIPIQMAEVQDPGPIRNSALAPWEADNEGGTRQPTGSPASQRETPETAYTPFRRQAMQPGRGDDSEPARSEPRPEATPYQLLKKMTRAVEKINEALTPEVIEEICALPDELRSRLVDAVEELEAKTRQLQ